MVPSRVEVRNLLAELASGAMTRERAAEAARPWIGDREAEVTDEVLWVPLSRLASADLESTPSEYLFDVWDFEAWLSEFELVADFVDQPGPRADGSTAERNYDSAVSAISALLHSFDPGGVGSTASAPEREYDGPASHLVAQARTGADMGVLLRDQFPRSSDRLVAVVCAVLELYLATGVPGSDQSDG